MCHSDGGVYTGEDTHFWGRRYLRKLYSSQFFCDPEIPVKYKGFTYFKALL
jgi:hypothetical protein